MTLTHLEYIEVFSSGCFKPLEFQAASQTQKTCDGRATLTLISIYEEQEYTYGSYEWTDGGCPNPTPRYIHTHARISEGHDSPHPYPPTKEKFCCAASSLQFVPVRPVVWCGMKRSGMRCRQIVFSGIPSPVPLKFYMVHSSQLSPDWQSSTSHLT